MSDPKEPEKPEALRITLKSASSANVKEEPKPTEQKGHSSLISLYIAEPEALKRFNSLRKTGLLKKEGEQAEIAKEGEKTETTATAPVVALKPTNRSLVDENTSNHENPEKKDAPRIVVKLRPSSKNLTEDLKTESERSNSQPAIPIALKPTNRDLVNDSEPPKAPEEPIEGYLIDNLLTSSS